MWRAIFVLIIIHYNFIIVGLMEKLCLSFSLIYFEIRHIYTIINSKSRLIMFNLKLTNRSFDKIFV